MLEHNHQSHRKQRTKYGGKNFIILPIVFCLVIYLVCYAVIAPTASTWLSVGSLFFSDNEKNFSDDYNNIFIPISEDPQTETSDNNEVSKPETSNGQNNKKVVKASSIQFPKYGEQFGELIIEDCQIYAKLFFGDGRVALDNGVGMYNGSSIPGYGKTILIAGHNNTYFNGLKYAQVKQRIKIRTSYGNYVYEITDMQAKLNTDKSAYDLSADYENLILYTCYPVDQLGITEYRYFVYAKFISGPSIDKNS